MALQPWRKGIVTKVEELSANTRSFTIAVPELEIFDFKPGQFVTLDLPIDEKPNKRWRSYSISSWPNGTNSFELCIVLNEEGKGTPFLFSEVKEGDELTLRGPVGVFTLPEVIDKDLFFICTGTGIAPFRSMVHHILKNNIPHKEIHLIFGSRKFGDALYASELKEMMRKEGDFYFHTVYSREEQENREHLVRLGYVHQVYEEICRGNMTPNEAGETIPKPARFFLCGWKNMIDEAKERILALGYDKKSIHLELYG